MIGHNLPQLKGELFQEFSKGIKLCMDKKQSFQAFRKQIGMPRGIFYHYVKEYIKITKYAIEIDNKTYIE